MFNKIFLNANLSTFENQNIAPVASGVWVLKLSIYVVRRPVLVYRKFIFNFVRGFFHRNRVSTTNAVILILYSKLRQSLTKISSASSCAYSPTVLMNSGAVYRKINGAIMPRSLKGPNHSTERNRSSDRICFIMHLITGRRLKEKL